MYKFILSLFCITGLIAKETEPSLPVYRNNLKNRNFDKEAPQNLDPERATIAERQGASEDRNSEVKPTQSKTDSSSCLGIEQEVQAALPLSHLGEQLQKARIGDYIVTHQRGNYSLLYVQANENNRLVMQEISLPKQNVHKTMNWEKWMRESAPGHTSWVLFEIDLEEGRIQESYDVSKKEWLYLQEGEHMLGKLLRLPMTELSDNERRRVGPPPSAGDPDHRAVWHPAQPFENAKGKTKTTAFRALWPSDDSPLSGCHIDLYYDLRQKDFPFPIGIDIQGTHYKLHVRVTKAGRHFQGVAQTLPRRSPRFLSQLQPCGTEYKIRLLCPHYYKKFELLALPASGKLLAPVSLPFRVEKGDSPDELVFTLKREELEGLLFKGCRYRLAFSSPPYAEGYAESDAIFNWH